MNVIMISLDKSLLEADYSGNVLERHQEYAERAGHLDIVVFSKKGFQKKEVSPHLTIYPTNSFSKLCYVRDAVKIIEGILRSDNAFSLREKSQRDFSLLGTARSSPTTSFPVFGIPKTERETASPFIAEKPEFRDRSGGGHHARSPFYAAQKHSPNACADLFLIVAQDPFLAGWAGWRIKKRFGVPLLLHFHGDFWDNRYWLWERWFNPFFLLASRFLVRRADGIRVVSAGIREKLIRKGIDRSKIRVIPTPVDIDKFEKYNAERVRIIKEKCLRDRKLIINVGRKSLAKDYLTLLKTIDLVQRQYSGKLAFWQIGANLDLNEMMGADEFGGQRLMAVSSPKISQEELVNYYQAAAVYVSSSRHESFGKVLVEAMAAGLPIVATATTGSREIVIDNENGFLAPIGNSQGLAKKILYLLEHPETARAMGEKGREAVKDRFDKKEIIDKIINFWQDLTADNR